MTELSCRLCKKRQFDLQRGLICSLTNDKANFVGTCKDLNIDKTEIQKFRFGKITNGLDFEKYEYKFPYQIKFKTDNEMVFYRSFFSYWQLYGFISLPLSLILNIVFNFKEPILIAVSLLTFFHLLISFAFLKQTVGKNKTPFLTLTNNFISIHEKKETIKWTDIARLYYRYYKGDYDDEQINFNIYLQKKWILIIEKFNNSIFEYDIYKVNNRKAKDYINSYYLKKNNCLQ